MAKLHRVSLTLHMRHRHHLTTTSWRPLSRLRRRLGITATGGDRCSGGTLCAPHLPLALRGGGTGCGCCIISRCGLAACGVIRSLRQRRIEFRRGSVERLAWPAWLRRACRWPGSADATAACRSGARGTRRVVFLLRRVRDVASGGQRRLPCRQRRGERCAIDDSTALCLSQHRIGGVATVVVVSRAAASLRRISKRHSPHERQGAAAATS